MNSNNNENQPRVLIVDDEPTLRLGFEYALNTEGYQVSSEDDGESAIRYLSNPDNPLPDVMLLDVRMPGKGGIDVLRELKNREIFVPTVLASAFMDSATAVQAIDLGVVDFIRKPVTPGDLRGVVRKVLDEEKAENLDSAGQVRTYVRRGQLDEAFACLDGGRIENGVIWRFLVAHLLACKKGQNEGQTEFASSEFYRATDLLDRLAYSAEG